MKSLTCVFAAMATVVSAQTPDFLLNGQAPNEPIVTGAPYSADAITTIRLVMFDGNRIDRQVTAKVWRDSAGRVRHEQTVVGLDPLNPASGGSMSVTTMFDPVAGVIYTLNPGSKTAMRISIPKTAMVPTPVVPPGTPAPPATREESLGTRQIEGSTATGRKTVMTIAAGLIGNDKPIDVSEERWESVDLKVLVFSRHHNPQTGDVEYRLTNIKRAEPARDLFTVPPDYKIMDVPMPARQFPRTFRPAPLHGAPTVG